jgi:hypothetical protein
MDQQTVFYALGEFVDQALVGAPASGTVSATGSQSVFDSAGEHGDPIKSKHIQRFTVTVIPHAKVPRETVKDVRDREAGRVLGKIRRDPTLAGRVSRLTDFVGADWSASVGEITVTYLVDID